MDYPAQQASAAVVQHITLYRKTCAGSVYHATGSGRVKCCCETHIRVWTDRTAIGDAGRSLLCSFAALKV